MPTKILVINSSADKNYLLARVFKELEQKQFSFSLRSSKLSLIGQFRENRWPAQKIFLGPDLKNKSNILFFAVILLFIQFKFLACLISLKIKRRVDLIICLNFNEKIIVTAPAKLLGVKIVWLEAPDINYRQLDKFLLCLYKINYGLAEIIAFNNYAKWQLNRLGFRDDKINLVPPGAGPNKYQENIFNKLASLNQTNFRRKYFTVGAITPLNQRQKIETVLRAVKICLPVIPNLQLIIIGEGADRKNLLWLAKKMEIENLVWLVGEQKQLKKWLDNFDIFLALSDPAKLDDYGNILEAMAAELPALGPRNAGLEDLIIENKTGFLIKSDDGETLAGQIIKLHQDKKLRLRLGRAGRERAERLFTLDKTVEALGKILRE